MGVSYAAPLCAYFSVDTDSSSKSLGGSPRVTAPPADLDNREAKMAYVEHLENAHDTVLAMRGQTGDFSGLITRHTLHRTRPRWLPPTLAQAAVMRRSPGLLQPLECARMDRQQRKESEPVAVNAGSVPPGFHRGSDAPTSSR